MSTLNTVHYPVYLSFEEKIICCECQLYYKCKSCIKLCKRQLDYNFGFVYNDYDCKDCSNRIKILVCISCNNINCIGCDSRDINKTSVKTSGIAI